MWWLRSERKREGEEEEGEKGECGQCGSTCSVYYKVYRRVQYIIIVNCCYLNKSFIYLLKFVFLNYVFSGLDT